MDTCEGLPLLLYLAGKVVTYTRTLKTPVSLPVEAKINAAVSRSQSKSGFFTGTRTGVKVEGWKELIAKGQVASSPYSLEMTKYVLAPEAYDVASYVSKALPKTYMSQSMRGYMGALNASIGVSHLTVDTSRARSEALSKLYKKLESDRSQMNAYASLAEITDVLRQFGRPFGSMVDAWMRHENRLIFEKRRLVGSKTWKDEKFAKIAADTWLETSFGLIPLFADAVSIAEAFGRFEYELSDKPKLRDRMRTRAFTRNASTWTSSIDAANGTFLKYQTVQQTETQARAQYVVGLQGDVRAEFGSNQRLLQLLGLEPRNIPLAIWEATPWSWLVDYGTNVQQILAAGATITSRVKWIVLSETKQTTVTHATKLVSTASEPFYVLQNLKQQPPPRRKGALNPGDFRFIRTSFARTLPSELGVPPLYFKSPLNDLKKTANLLALAVSRSRSHQTWLS